MFKEEKSAPREENGTQKENQSPPKGEKGPSYGDKPHPPPKNEKKAPQIDFSRRSERPCPLPLWAPISKCDYKMHNIFVSYLSHI